MKTRDLRLMYNLMPLPEFAAGAPGLHWRAFMTGADIDERHMSELVVEQPSFFTEVAALLTADRLQTWKVWLKWRVVGSYAPYLSSAFVDENFAFYGTTLQGTPMLRSGGSVASGWSRSARRGRRPCLRGAALLPGGQAADGRAGGEPDQGVPLLDH